MFFYFAVFVLLATWNLIRGDAKMAAGNLLGGIVLFPIIWYARKRLGLGK